MPPPPTKPAIERFMTFWVEEGGYGKNTKYIWYLYAEGYKIVKSPSEEPPDFRLYGQMARSRFQNRRFSLKKSGGGYLTAFQLQYYTAQISQSYQSYGSPLSPKSANNASTQVSQIFDAPPKLDGDLRVLPFKIFSVDIKYSDKSNSKNTKIPSTSTKKRSNHQGKKQKRGKNQHRG